jgi:hypothetical protein
MQLKLSAFTSSTTDEISVYNVCDIAFVFHPDVLERNMLTAPGWQVFFSSSE